MDSVLASLHPVTRRWFETRFKTPTEPQRHGWPAIADGRHTLLAAPTGSGKTLAAFLMSLDSLLRQSLAGTLADGVEVVYISPLKALGNDIHRNLEAPLAEITALAIAMGYGPLGIRTAVRSGDTPQKERQAMLRRPPHILVTTPESLYLLLTSSRARELLRGVRTVIVDEIHALVRDKRGSHLSFSLERLVDLCEHPPVRIGLSATQKPIEEVARFLVGAAHVAEDGTPDCHIVDGGHARELDLAIEVPPSELAAVCSHEQWEEIYERLTELIDQHRSTLIFVNTRRLTERIAHRLTERMGPEAVTSHHGSLSKELRLSAEQRLKDGTLRAIVATASLEMGIDIGFIDLVCQIGSPRSIAATLQRIGRSGHSLGATPKGRLFPLTRDELLECLALVRSIRRGELDRIIMPKLPLDILAQQIVAATAADDWDEEKLYALCRRSWSFRDLTREDFDLVVKMLAEGISAKLPRGKHLHRDGINHKLRARRGARLAAVTSGGAIPDTAEYRVVTEDDRTFVGKLDEDFAIESNAGDIFLLGNTSWRVRWIRGGEVVVSDAAGAPPTVPFWFGEGPGRTVELSEAVSQMREDIAESVRGATSNVVPEFLKEECGAPGWAAQQAADYVGAQVAAVGLAPTTKKIIFERFFDESGGMQLVIHSPLGARINRAWGLALRKRFCRSFDFELQAAADDNGVLLSIGPQHSFPIDSLFGMIGPHNAQYLLEQALLAAPMFQVRWRWNVTRALVVLRMRGGKKTPPHMLRFQSDDALAAVFPESVGCLENHHGDVELPDHVLVRQTVIDCLHEAMDIEGWLELLEDVKAGRVEFVARETREPSPFAHELLNANPYAFLDDAPLEERRTRAVSIRRGLSRGETDELGRLDPAAIEQVTAEAWPTVRDSEELHEALSSLVVAREEEIGRWDGWLEDLVAQGRAAKLVTRPGAKAASAKPEETNGHAEEANHTEHDHGHEHEHEEDAAGGRVLIEPLSFDDEPAAESDENEPATYWFAAENLPLVQALYPGATCEPPLHLPEELKREFEPSAARVALVRGRMQHSGPITAPRLARQLSLKTSEVGAALEAVEAEGVVLRGQFTPSAGENGNGQAELEWCDRRLLARIHRLTIDRLRQQIKPVEPADFVRYLLRHQRVLPGQQWAGPTGTREAVTQLAGFEMPAGAWENPVLAARLPEYDPAWLDQLFMSDELVWGRLRPPRRENGGKPSMGLLTRTVPISLVPREQLADLLPPVRELPSGLVRSAAEQVLEALQQRGALFFKEIATATNLLPTQLEEGLRELAALGLVTCDGFGAVRTIVAGKKETLRGRRYGRGRVRTATAPTGRWSLFPGLVGEVDEAERLTAWCHQLLARWGVVFRDLLTRESAAPAWGELAAIYRRMERRGEIRGGRFVAGVAGEQFATEAAVSQMRKARAEAVDVPHGDEPWVVISAADPLNLSGIVLPGPRVPATHTNRLILRGGVCIATRIAGNNEFFAELDETTQIAMSRALARGRKVAEEEAWPGRRRMPTAE